MKPPKLIDLPYIPSGKLIEAQIVELTPELIEQRMGEAWWSDPAIDGAQAAAEIDRGWDWSTLQIEREGVVLRSLGLAVLTSDGAVQGASLFSLDPVECTLEHGARALFV